MKPIFLFSLLMSVNSFASTERYFCSQENLESTPYFAATLDLNKEEEKFNLTMQKNSSAFTEEMPLQVSVDGCDFDSTLVYAMYGATHLECDADGDAGVGELRKVANTQGRYSLDLTFPNSAPFAELEDRTVRYTCNFQRYLK